jgi:ABC-type transporter Mla subunit MlaD
MTEYYQADHLGPILEKFGEQLTATANRFTDAVHALRADLRDHFTGLRNDLRAQHGTDRQIAALLHDLRSVIEAHRVERDLGARLERIESRLAGGG